MSMNETHAMKLKVQRTITAFLPVDEKRDGFCLNCGRCCQFVFRCPFYDGEGCAIYAVRPPQCRKYPRIREESIVPGCGFTFGD